MEAIEDEMTGSLRRRPFGRHAEERGRRRVNGGGRRLVVPLDGRRGRGITHDGELSLRVPGGDRGSSAPARDRHFDEAMELPARHTNDDGSRTTSRALVGSETPKKKNRTRKWTRNKPKTKRRGERKVVAKLYCDGCLFFLV